jgi:hypothetical protein
VLDFTYGPSVCSDSEREKINFYSLVLFFVFTWTKVPFTYKQRSITRDQKNSTSNLSEVRGLSLLLIITSEMHNVFYLGSFVDYSKYATIYSFYIFLNHSLFCVIYLNISGWKVPLNKLRYILNLPNCFCVICVFMCCVLL